MTSKNTMFEKLLTDNSDIENELLRLYQKGYNDRYITRILNKKFDKKVYAEHIQRWRKKRNLSANHTYTINVKCVIDDKLGSRITELFNQGVKIDDIRNKYGLTLAVLYEWRKKHDLIHKMKGRRLSNEENTLRLNFYNQGLTDAKIGKILNMSGPNITQWRNRHGLKKNICNQKQNDTIL